MRQNLNTNIQSFDGNRLLIGTDGDDLIDANALAFNGNGGAVQSISGNQGNDTIITSTNGNSTVVRLGLEDRFDTNTDTDGDADTLVVNSTGGRVDVFDFEDGDNGNDRIDLSNTGITSFDQLNISDNGNDTRIEANNLQTIV